MPDTTCPPGAGLGPHQHVKANCFTPPSLGTFGPSNYPYLAGPSYFDSDLAIAKTFHVTEGQTLTLRGSAFNFLNHPLSAFSGNQLNLYYNTNYETKASTLSVGAPGGSGATSPTFGSTVDSNGNPTKAGQPTQRVIQLSLKYEF
jgi:hypothetical protein